MSKRIYGIDLGTTNSCCAVVDEKGPKALVNSEGKRTTPSVVFFDQKRKICQVGAQALRQRYAHSEDTIIEAKRLIGCSYEEYKKKNDKLSYTVVRGEDGSACIKLSDGKIIRPESVSAEVLKTMAQIAADYYSCKIEELDGCVITVPAYFNDSQRTSTKNAAEIAGLKVLRIINEPTAAALAYGLEKKTKGKIAVYDFGGGTFDISILEINDGVFEVQSTGGDTHLGGANFDQAIVDYLIAFFKDTHGIDLTKEKDANNILARLFDTAEQAKMALSSLQEFEINLPFLAMGKDNQPKHLVVSLTRQKLESLVKHLIDRTTHSCKQALKDAGIEKVDYVILVGGMTRMPAIEKHVKQIFAVDEVIKTNPDEIVAYGAAYNAKMIVGDFKNEEKIVLLDVTPLSLGIETAGGVMSVIIDRNSTIPCKKTQIYSTYSDNQTGVTIRIFQGEGQMCDHNKLLGSFDLKDIPPAPRGVPQIEVTFDLSVDGILNVSAIEKTTGKTQKISVRDSGSLTKEQIEAMIQTAKQYEEEDKKRKELVELHNQSDGLIASTEKLLKEQQISAELRESIEKCLNNLRTETHNPNKSYAVLKEYYDALSNELGKVYEEISKKSSQPETNNNQ